MDSIPTIINRFLDIVVGPIFFGLIIIMFIWAGILFLTAQGDPTKITGAKKAVLWAVVGTAVGLLAFSVKGIIAKILGV
jgi:hypothetical protein